MNVIIELDSRGMSQRWQAILLLHLRPKSALLIGWMNRRRVYALLRCVHWLRRVHLMMQPILSHQADAIDQIVAYPNYIYNDTYLSVLYNWVRYL